MVAEQATPSEAILQLPITGRRHGENGIVIAHALVLDDEFSRTILANFHWNLSNMGYAYRRAPRPSRAVILLHHTVFGHYHGAVPAGLEVDHIDRNPLNDLPSNLRAVTHSMNMHNRRRNSNNTLGLIGIKRNGKRWAAGIMVCRQKIYLGTFDSPREAANAYNIAFSEYFPHLPTPNP